MANKIKYEIIRKYHYETTLPFTQFVKGRSVEKKKSSLYLLKADDGKYYTTELSPFPGLSSDRLPVLEQTFEKCLNCQTTHQNPHIAFSLFELELKKNWHSPMIPQIMHVQKNTLMHYQKPDFSFKTNCLKIKIDHQLEDVLSFFKQNQSHLQGLSLRLDANQRLTPAQVYKIHDSLSDLGLTLEYFEEPFNNLKDYQGLQVPFALDENIKSYQTFQGEYLKGLVFKPTQSFSSNLWQQQSTPMIISSTYDSIFTHMTLHALALKWPKAAHGLDVMGHHFGLALEQADEIFPSLHEKHLDLIGD